VRSASSTRPSDFWLDEGLASLALGVEAVELHVEPTERYPLVPAV
jgi:hypothetical protein